MALQRSDLRDFWWREDNDGDIKGTTTAPTKYATDCFPNVPVLVLTESSAASIWISLLPAKYLTLFKVRMNETCSGYTTRNGRTAAPLRVLALTKASELI